MSYEKIIHDQNTDKWSLGWMKDNMYINGHKNTSDIVQRDFQPCDSDNDPLF